MTAGAASGPMRWRIHGGSPSTILVYNPYGETGGGGEYQPFLRHALGEAAPDASVEEISVPLRRRGIVGYLRQARAVHGVRSRLLDCDLLVVQGFLNVGSWSLARAAIRAGIPYIVIPHGDHAPEWTRGAWASVLRKRVATATYGRNVLRNAVAVVVASGLEGERIARHVPEVRTNLRLIPNAAEVTLNPEPRNTGESAPYAVWLGVLSAEKNLEFLLDCWPRVRTRVPQAVLALAGRFDNGALAKRLHEIVRRLDLQDAVRFTGYLTGQEKLRALAAARCLVLPSRFESFGRVVAEALAERTPVVVSSATPWDALPPAAGRRLTLDRDVWVDTLVHYLGSPTKLTVPRAVAEAVLAPSTAASVVAKWKLLITELAAHPTTRE